MSRRGSSRGRKGAEKRPAELIKFNFYGDELDVFQAGTSTLVSIRRICEAIGLGYSSQLQKLRADESVCVTMIVTQMPGDDQAREIACVDVRSLPLWLATIHPSKVSHHIKDKLIAYKRECAEVLADHFLGPRGPRIDERLKRAEAECETLRARLDLFESHGSGLIGKERANHLILANLRAASRRACITTGDTSQTTFQREFKKREDELRNHVGFPRELAHSWGNLPITKCGDAALKVLEILEADRRRATPEIDTQLDLFGPSYDALRA
ncbi:phage antirepressor N-terminal domain-containing protein [Sorangium sp. So ce375]|uniref:phage antirepressor N-terminal domain-containing protein n=1 Tax=Sorangium sp. So ce375 TaxID=3133306 RepID=UPI003F5B00A1